MAVERARRCPRHGARRHAGDLPVLRWLQVGAAAAGVGVALMAVPGTALADTETTSSGSESSQAAGPSAAAASSPAAAGAATADADNSVDGSGSGNQDDSTTVGEADDDGDPTSSESEPTRGEDSSDPLIEGPDTSVDAEDSAADDDATDAADEVSDNPAQTNRTGGQGAPEPATGDAEDSTGDSSVASTLSEEPTSDSTDVEVVTTDTAHTGAATSVAFSQRTVPAPATVAHSTGQPDYPEWVSAPVTWQSILTEGLSWLSLGALAPTLPGPQLPVPDLIAQVWVGMRRLHYTFFNSAPRLDHSGYTADPWTGVITGNLGGFDADGDVITYAVTNAPAHGIVHISDDGTYTYTPDSEFAVGGGTDTFSVVAEDTGAANRWHINPVSGLLAGWRSLLTGLGLAAPTDGSTATINLIGIPVICDAAGDDCAAPPVNHSPAVTVHNNSDNTIWVYNLPTSGDYSVKQPPVVPVSIKKGGSASVTLAVGTGSPGEPENRIYIVEGDSGFTLPVDSSGGVDAFNPTAATAGNSFQNYSFLEYFLYPANGGYEYTIDTSYIDEWSLPSQFKFTIPHGVNWTGAKSGTTYGFSDFDTVASQLKAAGGPYKDLVWSGRTPWGPQPPATVSRIIGPDKVWAQQSAQPASNIHMNTVGWVPASYSDFVLYGGQTHPQEPTTYPYAYNGHEYSAVINNFDFWKNEVTAPAGTPYPIALRTAAKLDGFPAVDGVWGFFTYPNDEAAGQFTNIPNTVSLDIYVHGSADGVSDSLIDGGKWLYSSSPTRSDADLLKPGRNMLVGTGSTDTFILDYLYTSRRATPLVIAQRDDHDIIAIDKTALVGATSNEVDIVDCFWFLGGGFANYDSQFIYDRSSGLLYYDRYPDRFGYTGVLANLSLSQIDPADAVFVL
ncbi:MAG: hypothetical protein KDB44_08620 [Mycobacterium sp.]|nr:hypothetical protein [Mycobacterium sp.]